jgi:CTP-dependent riboflavin kinase
MDSKEITDRLKVSEKTVYSFINTSEAEGWIEVSRSKRGSYYKASQEVVDSYYRFLNRYFKAVKAHNLKKNFDMVAHLDEFRNPQNCC